METRKRILWVDGLAGLFVGVCTLGLNGWLSAFYGLPQSLVLFIGGANLAYGTYSTSLALRAIRPPKLIILLVVLNFCWTVVCISMVILYGPRATFFGLAHIVLEGLFVTGLAWIEWRWRDQLVTA